MIEGCSSTYNCHFIVKSIRYKQWVKSYNSKLIPTVSFVTYFIHSQLQFTSYRLSFLKRRLTFCAFSPFSHYECATHRRFRHTAAKYPSAKAVILRQHCHLFLSLHRDEDMAMGRSETEIVRRSSSNVTKLLEYAIHIILDHSWHRLLGSSMHHCPLQLRAQSFFCLFQENLTTRFNSKCKRNNNNGMNSTKSGNPLSIYSKTYGSLFTHTIRVPSMQRFLWFFATATAENGATIRPTYFINGKGVSDHKVTRSVETTRAGPGEGKLFFRILKRHSHDTPNSFPVWALVKGNTVKSLCAAVQSQWSLNTLIKRAVPSKVSSPLLLKQQNKK